MDRETLESVLDKHRLPNGTAWPMPLLLQFSETQIKDLAVGERITLCNDTGEIHAVLDVSEIYQLNLENLAQRWFDTASPQHSGVAHVC
jgi:ATP sulfurylase